MPLNSQRAANINVNIGNMCDFEYCKQIIKANYCWFQYAVGFFFFGITLKPNWTCGGSSKMVLSKMLNKQEFI